MSRSASAICSTSPRKSARPSPPTRTLVYAPHIYTHVFTADASFLGIPPGTSPYPPSYDFGYATALSEGQAMHSALFVTEFGNPPSQDPTVLAGMTQAQQVALVGGSLWAWSGNTTDKTLGSCWAVYCRYVGRSDLPGHVPTATETLLPSRVTYLSRVTPALTAGTLLSYADDPTTGSFSMVASDPVAVTKGDRAAETVVAVPPRVHGPLSVAGRAVLDTVVTRPDGSRVAYVAPTGSPTGAATGSASTDGSSARYQITVGSPPGSVTAAATGQAAAPLQPIAEPEARAQLESALATLATSGSAAERGKVAEASALLGTLFGSGPDPNGPG